MLASHVVSLDISKRIVGVIMQSLMFKVDNHNEHQKLMGFIPFMVVMRWKKA